VIIFNRSTLQIEYLPIDPKDSLFSSLPYEFSSLLVGVVEKVFLSIWLCWY